MKLLLATSSYPLHPRDGTAAAGLFVRDVACALRDRGVEVTVLTQDRPGPVADDEGLRVVRFPWWGRGRPIGSYHAGRPLDLAQGAGLLLLGARALARLSRGDPPDRILAFWALPAGAWAWAASLRDGITYDCWALGSDIWKGTSHRLVLPLLRRVLSRAERCFADGEELARLASAASGRDVAVLPSVRGCSPGPVVRAPGENRIVFIGRWERAKGPDLLPRAAEILRMAGWEFELEIRGLGGLGDRMRSDIRRLELDPWVSLGGPVPPDEAGRLIESADWVVIPSREESVPLILGDALARGRPVVATDVGDLGAEVRRLGAGILASRPTPSALAGALARALSSDPGSYALRAAARRWSLDEVADRLLGMIREPEPVGGEG